MKSISSFTAGASLLLCLYALCSCHSEQDNSVILQQIDEGLAQSNRQIRMSTDDILQSLQNKVEDSKTAGKAKLIQPKALAVHKLSDSVTEYIDGLKSELNQSASRNKESVQGLFEKEGKAAELYSRLQRYKQTTLGLDERLRMEFDNSFVLISKDIDTAENGNEKLGQRVLRSSLPEAGAYLSRIQNSIATDENKLVLALFQQTNSHIIIDDFLSAIVGQNAKVLEAGDVLEITAAIGGFRRYPAETIFVNKRSVPINDYGLAVYKMKTSSKLGSYSIPVQVKLTDQDGNEQTRTITVEYKTVSAPFK